MQNVLLRVRLRPAVLLAVGRHAVKMIFDRCELIMLSGSGQVVYTTVAGTVF